MQFENKSLPATRTREIVIEVCPKCNTLHYFVLNGGLLDIEGLGKEEVQCGQQIGWLPPTDEKQTELEPKLCDYTIKSKEDNTFTIRHFTLRERQDYTSIAFPTGKETAMEAANNPKVVDFCLTHGVVKAPFALKTAEDIGKAEVVASVLLQLYAAVVGYNQPPLPPSSRLPLQSTRTIHPSVKKTP